MKEDENEVIWDIDEIQMKPKLTHNKCPVCRKIHGKKAKGNRNTVCDNWDCLFKVLDGVEW